MCKDLSAPLICDVSGVCVLGVTSAPKNSPRKDLNVVKVMRLRKERRSQSAARFAKRHLETMFEFKVDMVRFLISTVLALTLCRSDFET